MTQGQILVLGAIAGLTIFIGLPAGRIRGLSASTCSFLSATATGILLFLLWDVLSAGLDHGRVRRSPPQRSTTTERGRGSPVSPLCSSSDSSLG